MNVIISSKTWKDYQNMIVPLFETYLSNEISDMKDHVLTTQHYYIVGKENQKQGIQNNKCLQYNIVRNSGHNIMIDQPDIVIHKFQNFIDYI